MVLPQAPTKPDNHRGEDVFNMVKDVQVVFGKGPGSQPVPNDANRHAPMWKKKSIFWELPSLVDNRALLPVGNPL